MKIITNEHLFKIGVLPSEIFIGNNGMTSLFPDIKWEVILPVGVRTNTALYPTDVYLPNWQVRLMLNKKKKERTCIMHENIFNKHTTNHRSQVYVLKIRKCQRKWMRVCFIQGNIFEFSSQPFDKNLVNNGRIAPDEKNCDEPDYIFSKYLTCSILCR